MKTIEVYKTDINERSKADTILDKIRRNLPGSDPSIDLEDCDNVLRVENPLSGINESQIRQILSDYGYKMEVLP